MNSIHHSNVPDKKADRKSGHSSFQGSPLSSKKTEILLVLICGFIAVVVFATFNLSHLYIQIFKKSVYSQVEIFGSDCTVRTGIEFEGSSSQSSVNLLLDQYSSLVAQSEKLGMRPAPMPFRQTVSPPVTKPGFVLHTRCQVKSEKLNNQGYLKINLGRVYGDSLLIFTPETIYPLKGGEIAEVYLPLNLRRNPLQFDLFSLGVPSGAAGLGTLLPLYLSSTSESDRAIQRRLDSLYVDQPLFRVGLALVILFLFISLWLFGLRYQDIFWMILYSTATVLIYLAVYSIPYRLWFYPWIWRIYGNLAFLQVVFLFLFSVMYLRPDSRVFSQIVPQVALGIALIYSVVCYVVTDEVFLEYKLLMFFPSVVATLVFGLFSSSLMYCFALNVKGQIHDQGKPGPAQLERVRREKILLVLTSSATVIWGIQSFVVEKYAIQIDGIVQGLLMTLFGGINLYDLAWRQRAYFRQKLENEVEVERTSYAQNLVRQLNQVAHDLKQPLDYLAHRSNQPAESARIAAFALDLIHDLALIDPSRKVVWKKGVITPFCTEICSHFSSLYSRKVEFYCDKQSQVQTYDSVLVKRILVNLLQNAVDNTKTDDLITLSVIDNEWSVKNSGTPIAELVLTAIQAGQSVSQRGTGTGLQFVREALQKLNSQLEVKSSAETGTVFHFNLPDPLSIIKQFHEQSFFIIDDDFFVKKLWSGRQVNFYSSVSEFHQSDWRTRGKVFILDYNFPREETTGLDLAQKIRLHLPNSVILLATNQQLNVIPEYLDALVEKGPFYN